MATTAAGTPYVESSDLVANYPGVSLALANHIDTSTGKVLQVVGNTHGTTVSTTSTSFVTTGLSASITPSLASSRIMIICSLYFYNAGGTVTNAAYATLFRGTVAGTNLGHSTEGLAVLYADSASPFRVYSLQTMTFLDSPNTTSAQVYTAGMRASANVTATAQGGSGISTITLMEIGA